MGQVFSEVEVHQRVACEHIVKSVTCVYAIRKFRIICLCIYTGIWNKQSSKECIWWILGLKFDALNTINFTGHIYIVWKLRSSFCTIKIIYIENIVYVPRLCFYMGRRCWRSKETFVKGFPLANSSFEMLFATNFVEHVQDKPVGC